MLSMNGNKNGKGNLEISGSLQESLPSLTFSSVDDFSTYSPWLSHRKLNDLPVAGAGKSKGNTAKKKNQVVESLSIWPTMANLLKAEQYDRAAELLDQAQLAEQPPGSEAGTTLLVMAREICLAYRQYQIEIAQHQQALEAANRQARELSQQLYAIFTHPAEHLRSGQGDEVTRSWAILTEAGVEQKQPGRKTASLKIYCLGPFQVNLNGRLISEWSSLKARSIFKYLVTYPDGPTTSDTLMDIFWPDADPEGARHNLHQAIHSLRKTLKQGVDIQPILFESDGYSLNPELNLWFDHVEFEKQVQLGLRLEKAGCLTQALAAYRRAVEFYRGDFLVEDRYEDWSGLQREYLRQLYLELVDQLSETCLQQGDFAETIAFCRKILAQDNCHEATHRRLMRCYLLQGQWHSAIRQYQSCVRVLKTELDVPPSPATQLLYEQLVQT